MATSKARPTTMLKKALKESLHSRQIQYALAEYFFLMFPTHLHKEFANALFLCNYDLIALHQEKT